MKQCICIVPPPESGGHFIRGDVYYYVEHRGRHGVRDWGYDIYFEPMHYINMDSEQFKNHFLRY